MPPNSTSKYRIALWVLMEESLWDKEATTPVALLHLVGGRQASNWVAHNPESIGLIEEGPRVWDCGCERCTVRYCGGGGQGHDQGRAGGVGDHRPADTSGPLPLHRNSTEELVLFGDTASKR